MKNLFSFRISAKVGLGFGVLTLAIIINTVLITKGLNKSRYLNEQITEVYQPSVSQLVQLHSLVNNSELLLRNWIFLDKISKTAEKLKLLKIHEETLPALLVSLSSLTDQWSAGDKKEYTDVCSKLRDSLFTTQRLIIDNLLRLEKKDDPAIMAGIIPMVTYNGTVVTQTERTLACLTGLIDKQQANVAAARLEMENQLSNLKNYIFYTSIILVFVSLILAIFTVRSLVAPINFIRRTLLSMSKGILPSKKIEERSDEIGEMATALNSLVVGLKAISNFALEIGRGNYNSKFTPLSNDDVLGNSLLRMRDDLKTAAEEEKKRKLEDEQRNWATAGMAKFGDILRKDNNKLDVLSYNVISNLVEYLGANQGGLFVISEDASGEKGLDLVASYAYNRQKFLKKRIEMKEGLVGRCALERETIYLTDIPDNYIRINSGLGDANPKSLLLVPMIMNDELFGIIEIASFEEIQKYQIEFVEKIAESIASTLSTVRFNMQTTKLLEQSKIQAEELASREEEMRQNMEELRATQEQTARKEVEMQNTILDLKKKLNEKSS